MALRYSPKIITDSLVMCLDPSQNKSYPTTDLPVKGGLGLWLDASDDSTFSYSSGTSVSQWRDKSGNNRHFFQSTVGNQPSRSAVINSRKAIQFTAASNQYLRYNSTIINNSTGGSVFVVWRTSGEAQAYSSILDNYHCGGNALGAGFQIERNVTNNQYYWGFNTPGCGNGGFMPATAYSNDTTNCIWITKDSTTITGGLNGTSGTPNASPSATWVEDTKGWTIGCWGNGAETFGRFYNGQHCEVIIFNRGLSATEVKQVNTYLGQKWGIVNTDRSIVDLSGNNYSGSFGGAAGSQNVANMPDYDFYNKGALTFNGSSDEVNFGDILKFTTSQDFTLEVWVNYIPNSTSYVPLLSKEDASTGFGYALKVDETYSYNPYLVLTGPSAYRYANININDGLWHHIVGVAKSASATIDIYVDGVLRNGISNLVSWTGTPTSNVLRLGKNVGSAFFKGKLSNSKIYNRALSATEISQNYEAQKSKFANTIVQQGLVLNLDAGNPYSYAGAGTTWIDVSGNSNNGTLINSPTYSVDNGGLLNWASASSQYATVAMNSGLRVANITQEAWVYLNSTADQVFIGSQYGTSSNNSFALWLQGNTFYFGVNTGGTFYNTGSSVPSTSTWYHLVHTYNGSTQYLYINGVLTTTYNSSASGNISYDLNNTKLAIAADFNGPGYDTGPTAFVNGKMPIVKIYNIALSAAQVLQNYNATKGRFGL